jgi:glycosyltransferase involved in cell wall biosynthesis
VALDDRFIAIHQENEGTAHARNIGIKQAQGEFLTFVDSDDWLEPYALELLYRKQKETDADIVMGGIRDIYPWGVRTYQYPKIAGNMSCLVYLFLSNRRTLWGKLYRKALFIDYIVPENNFGEDAIVNIQIFSKINTGKLQMIDEIIYNYDCCTNGITARVSKRCNYNSYKESPVVNCRLWIERYLNENNQKKEVMDAFAYYTSAGLVQYLRYNKNITREEAVLFYTHYYRDCSYKGNISIRNRLLLSLFYRSIILGKIYRFFMNGFVDMIKYILGLIRREKI